MGDKPARAVPRQMKVGQVVSRSGEKTIVVEVTRQVKHSMYQRYVRRSKKFYAHDAENRCRVGDRVRIVQSRPLSRLKRWRLQEILYRAEAAPAEAPSSQPPAQETVP